METRITYQVNEEEYGGSVSSRRSRGKKKFITIKITIPGNWGMFSPEGNTALLQNAIQAVERISKLVGHLNDPSTARNARNLKRKFKAYYNTILFLYYSGYHHLNEFHYGQCPLRLPEEIDSFDGLSGTHIRDLVAEFGEVLMDLICRIPLTKISPEELMDWNNYYDLPTF